jgi:hypothetical protein
MAGIIAAEASIDEIEASFNMVSKSCNKSKPILKAICELDMRVSYHQELWILPLLHLRDAVVIGAELPEALGMGRFSIAEVSRLRSTAGYDLVGRVVYGARIRPATHRPRADSAHAGLKHLRHNVGGFRNG